MYFNFERERCHLSGSQHEMMNLRIFSICVKIRKCVAFSLRKSYSFRIDA